MSPFTAGDRVVQPTYGPGTIVEFTDQHVVIDFDHPGLDRTTRRIFAAKLVVLAPFVQPPSSPASTKPRAKKEKK